MLDFLLVTTGDRSLAPSLGLLRALEMADTGFAVRVACSEER